MPKLRFDPITYQFDYRCRPEERASAHTAGFDWDPIRGRYYTGDPHVAAALAGSGDDYVMGLLADVLGAEFACGRPAAAELSPQWAAGTAKISGGLHAMH
jgi:hypothetical protein